MSLSGQAPRSQRQLLALGWLSVVILTALLADWLPLPYALNAPDLTHLAQSPLTSGTVSRHWLGTDPLGRDVLAGMVFGARTALLVSLPSALLATALGVVLGSLAGFWGNTELRLPLGYWLAIVGAFLLCFLSVSALWPTTAWYWPFLAGLCIVGIVTCTPYLHFFSCAVALPADGLVMSAVALLESIPRLILVLIVAAVRDASIFNLLLILVATYWTSPARLVRAEILRVKALPYVEAARATGLSNTAILLRHVLPNASQGVRTSFPLSISALVGLETTLSFLGIGLPAETASWGRLMATARLDSTAWWLVAFPAFALLCTMLALRQLAKASPGK